MSKVTIRVDVDFSEGELKNLTGELWNKAEQRILNVLRKYDLRRLGRIKIVRPFCTLRWLCLGSTTVYLCNNPFHIRKHLRRFSQRKYFR